MAAEHGGAARGDGAQGSALSARQRVGLLVRRAVGADDVGELDAGRTLDGDPHGGRRRSGHSSGGGWLGQIQRGAGVEHALLRQMEIARGGGEMAVAKKLLDPG